MSENKISIGQVLWNMRGIRQNGKIKWHAHPMCVEYVNKHKFLDANNCGGSINSIGRNYYLTRQEAIDSFLKEYGSLEQDIDINAPLEKMLIDAGVKEKPRTDWETFTVTKRNDINFASVYIGDFNRLESITDKIEWRWEYVDYAGEAWERLTLEEIRAQANSLSKNRFVTVFAKSPMNCEIYQCGNYPGNKWVKLGRVMGYA